MVEKPLLSHSCDAIIGAPHRSTKRKEKSQIKNLYV